METLYKMPTRDRQFYIMKHNENMEAINKASKHGKKEKQVNGESINTYAKLEQEKMKNVKRG